MIIFQDSGLFSLLSNNSRTNIFTEVPITKLYYYLFSYVVDRAEDNTTKNSSSRKL